MQCKTIEVINQYYLCLTLILHKNNSKIATDDMEWCKYKYRSLVEIIMNG